VPIGPLNIFPVLLVPGKTEGVKEGGEGSQGDAAGKTGHGDLGFGAVVGQRGPQNFDWRPC
jgi:hypothetical protein